MMADDDRPRAPPPAWHRADRRWPRSTPARRGPVAAHRRPWRDTSIRRRAAIASPATHTRVADRASRRCDEQVRILREDFLDAVPLAVAALVARMPRRSCIDVGAAPVRDLLSDVRGLDVEEHDLSRVQAGGGQFEPPPAARPRRLVPAGRMLALRWRSAAPRPGAI